MISQVTTPAQQEKFREMVRGRICLEAMMETALTLFGEKPAAGFQFFLSREGALMIQGSLATAAGKFDPEELDSFLGFLGISRLMGEKLCLPGWEKKETLTACRGMGPALEGPPAGTRLVTRPSLMEFSRLVLEEESSQEQENFYAQSCIRVNHNMGRCWALSREEKLVCGVSVSGMTDQWAYLTQGYTRPEFRGQGLGGWLIAALGNRMMQEGKTPCLLCLPSRKAFYKRLGMTVEKEYYLYNKRK